MTAVRLHQLNLGLLLLSAAVAVVWPFETLLLAYAILGPLHYLTEISWLHDRQYFLPSRASRWGLGTAVAVLLVAFFGSQGPVLSVLHAHRVGLLFSVFAAVPIVLFLRTWQARALGVGLAGLIGWAGQAYGLDLIIGVYLATLIHVFVFTGIFAWNGMRRQPERWGYAFMGFFLVMPLVCLVLPTGWSVAPSDWAQHNYGLLFSALNATTLAVAGHPIALGEVFSQPWSIALTRCIALAYTYHYLNWFSKPTVIQWHRVSAERWVVMGTLWVGAVALYATNYLLGFIVLLSLSFAHVVLEFPLNHLSLRQLLGPQRSA